MKSIVYTPIGIVHSPFVSSNEAPIQPRFAAGAEGQIELYAEYEEALSELDRFSHIVLIYHLHLVKRSLLKVKPSHSDSLRGVFATRAPQRPNPIGISTVRLKAIDGTTLHVIGIDIVDGTPLLDIKPFIPTIDGQHGANIGWLADMYDGE
jgi:tRNA-Thr(GGU) m(6)t(6)A37 methyltransferase TsaA